MSLDQTRADVAAAVRLLHASGMICPFGHVSARIDEAHIAILSHLHGSERSPGRVEAADVTLVDPEGRPYPGWADPPGEVFIHTEIYRRRTDVGAVAHFHPFHALALSSAGREVLPLTILAHALAPAVPIYPDPEQVEDLPAGARLAEFLGPRRAAVLRWHGAVTCGADVPQAFSIALALEESARMQLLALAAGTPQPIGGSDGAFPPSYARMDASIAEAVWRYRLSAEAESRTGHQPVKSAHGCGPTGSGDEVGA